MGTSGSSAHHLEWAPQDADEFSGLRKHLERTQTCRPFAIAEGATRRGGPMSPAYRANGAPSAPFATLAPSPPEAPGKPPRPKIAVRTRTKVGKAAGEAGEPARTRGGDGRENNTIPRTISASAPLACRASCSPPTRNPRIPARGTGAGVQGGTKRGREGKDGSGGKESRGGQSRCTPRGGSANAVKSKPHRWSR